MAVPALRSAIQCGGRRPRAITFYLLEAFARYRRFGSGGGSILSQATDKIPTYVVGLDDRLSGGIPRGHIVLVAGPPGSPKSSFVYRILFHEAKEHGASGPYLSMGQSRTSLLSQMTSLGMDPGHPKGGPLIA